MDFASAPADVYQSYSNLDYWSHLYIFKYVNMSLELIADTDNADRKRVEPGELKISFGA